MRVKTSLLPLLALMACDVDAPEGRPTDPWIGPGHPAIGTHDEEPGAQVPPPPSPLLHSTGAFHLHVEAVIYPRHYTQPGGRAAQADVDAYVMSVRAGIQEAFNALHVGTGGMIVVDQIDVTVNERAIQQSHYDLHGNGTYHLDHTVISAMAAEDFSPDAIRITFPMNNGLPTSNWAHWSHDGTIEMAGTWPSAIAHEFMHVVDQRLHTRGEPGMKHADDFTPGSDPCILTAAATAPGGLPDWLSPEFIRNIFAYDEACNGALIDYCVLDGHLGELVGDGCDAGQILNPVMAGSYDDAPAVQVSNGTGDGLWVRCAGDVGPGCDDWAYLQPGASASVATPDARLYLDNQQLGASAYFVWHEATAPTEAVTVHANATDPFAPSGGGAEPPPPASSEAELRVINETGAPLFVRCDGPASASCSEWIYLVAGAAAQVHAPEGRLLLDNQDWLPGVRWSGMPLQSPSAIVSVYANEADPLQPVGHTGVTVHNQTGSPLFVRCDGTVGPGCADWIYLATGAHAFVATPVRRLFLDNQSWSSAVSFSWTQVVAPGASAVVYPNQSTPLDP